MRATIGWVLCAVALMACDAFADQPGEVGNAGAGGVGGQPRVPLAGAGGRPATAGSFATMPMSAGSAASDPVPAAVPAPAPEPACSPGAFQLLGQGPFDFCNGLDDDCDGRVDEDLDNDGDGFSACATANALPLDCDHDRADVHPGHVELCDGVDNDCDGLWDEGNAGPCPDPVCDHARECPGGLVCDWETHEKCIEPMACPETETTEATCEPPDAMWEASECDPTRCWRWQSGTCWGTCECAPDGVYRWKIGCTE